MATYQFSRAITVHDFEGTELGNGASITDRKRANKFLDNVKDALKGLKKTPTGYKLIDEIDNSGKTCDIILAAPGKDGCAMTKPNGDFSAQFASQIKSFRPGVMNLEIGQRDRTQNKGIKGRDETMPTRAEEFYEKKYTQQMGFKQTAANTGGELKVILDRMQSRYGDPLKFMSQITGKNTITLYRMANGVEPVDDRTYYQICVHFYDFLTPGAGCNTVVRLGFDVGLTGTGGGKNYKKDADAVDPRVMAGHELIHAWRMMKGKRIVRAGWEEEAMTVGLAFAAGWEMTENRLRGELGQPRRNRYAGSVDVSSHWASNVRNAKYT
jgi:hypothetical protein